MSSSTSGDTTPIKIRLTVAAHGSPMSTSPVTPPLLEPSLGSDLVKLHVGEKRKEFVIHKKLLCQSSHFFDAVFNGPYVEGQEGSIYLPEDDPGAFSLYIEWLYRGTIREGNTEQHLHDLYDLYFLGEKICLIKLKNQTMDAIQDMAREFDLREKLVNRELLTKVVENTCGSASVVTGLRSFAAYVLSWNGIINGLKTKSSLKAAQLKVDVRSTDIFDYSDHHLVWEVCRDDFAFLQTFLRWHESNLRSITGGNFETRCDPRKRSKTDPEDWCFFHDHSDGSECRPFEVSRRLFVSFDGDEAKSEGSS